MPEAKERREVQEMFRLRGRTAIITGGAGLLGQKHAEAIAAAGGSVALVDQNRAGVQKMARGITERYGVKALGVGCNIAKKKEVEAMVEKVVSRFHRIDILINNARMSVKSKRDADEYFAPYETYAQTIWERVLAVNLTGMFLCTQAAGKVMLKQKRGTIINIASIYGIVSPNHEIYRNVKGPYYGKPFNTPISYAASKTAIIQFTRYLATYWAKKNIRVNALSPGGVYDDHDATFVKNYSSLVPMGRMARRDEYKGAILFLASDASSYMTGANLIVDGGLTCW